MEPRHGNEKGGLVSERVYLRPPWSARVVGNRMAAIFRPSVVWQLSVRGRRTGRWHTVPVAVLDHDRERYLLAPRGETDWALNLRASGTGRPGLIEAYLARYASMPTVARTFRALPDPADHPVFQITGSTSHDPGTRPEGTSR